MSVMSNMCVLGSVIGNEDAGAVEQPVCELGDDMSQSEVDKHREWVNMVLDRSNDAYLLEMHNASPIEPPPADVIDSEIRYG